MLKRNRYLMAEAGVALRPASPIAFSASLPTQSITQGLSGLTVGTADC